LNGSSETISVGLLSLGGLVVPVLGPDLSGDGPVSVFCCNSRPGQKAGLFRLLAISGGETIQEQVLELDAERCGEALFQVDFQSDDSGSILVTSQLLRGASQSLPESVSIQLPPTVAAVSEEEEWNLQAVRAQAVVRWYRAMLMERDVRIQLRDDFRRIRRLADDVDAAIRVDDHSSVLGGVTKLLALAIELEAQTGIPPFPSGTPLVFLPDPAG